MKKILIVINLMMFCCIQVTSDNYVYNDYNKNKDNDITFIDDSYGYIEIPKINLSKKFVENGNIDKNIIVVKPSVYPNKEESLLILAAHSGTGKYAYFNYLYKLKTKDNIYITYMNKKYTYNIVDIYYQKKDGKLDVYKIKNTKTLVLITCTNSKRDLQTIYIATIVEN